MREAKEREEDIWAEVNEIKAQLPSEVREGIAKYNSTYADLELDFERFEMFQHTC